MPAHSENGRDLHLIEKTFQLLLHTAWCGQLCYMVKLFFCDFSLITLLVGWGEPHLTSCLPLNHFGKSKQILGTYFERESIHAKLPKTVFAFTTTSNPVGQFELHNMCIDFPLHRLELSILVNILGGLHSQLIKIQHPLLSCGQSVDQVLSIFPALELLPSSGHAAGKGNKNIHLCCGSYPVCSF